MRPQLARHRRQSDAAFASWQPHDQHPARRHLLRPGLRRRLVAGPRCLGVADGFESGVDERVTAIRPPRSRFRWVDSIDEVLAGVLARPTRAMLTTLGTVLGLASLVATLGISATAGNQIVSRFDELAATQVSIRPSASSQNAGRDGDRATNALPWNVEARLDRLNGVVASGAVANVINSGQVRTVPLVDPTGQSARTLPVLAASSGVLDAVGGHIAAGRWFDDGHIARADPVAVIGVDVADQFGITDLAQQPGIFIGENFFTVIGILDSADRDRGFVGSIMVPPSVAASAFGTKGPDRIIVHVELGAAELVASQAPTALSPNAPESISASAPQAPNRARDDVETDVNSLFLLLGLISLAVGAIGIANVTLVTVMERTGEIGLRRALGARRRHIAGQFLGESAAMGLVGGILGSSLGIVVVVVVSASRGWTPVLDAWLPLAAPVAGAAVGLLAGLHPSIRAARMEPVDALRAGL